MENRHKSKHKTHLMCSIHTLDHHFILYGGALHLHFADHLRSPEISHRIPCLWPHISSTFVKYSPPPKKEAQRRKVLFGSHIEGIQVIVAGGYHSKSPRQLASVLGQEPERGERGGVSSLFIIQSDGCPNVGLVVLLFWKYPHGDSQRCVS